MGIAASGGQGLTTATVVLMAGGLGLRLHPLTANIPKPMLHVGEKPIIQQIVEGYQSQGFTRFVMCLGYRADVIKSHFRDGAFWGIDVSYTYEPDGKHLGTAGALRKIPKQNGPVIVQNADILTKFSAHALLTSHADSGCAATVCVTDHLYQIPFGVAVLNGDRLQSTDEKPIKSWPVLAGIYVLSPEALRLVPPGASNMPDLLGRVRDVNVFHLRNHWTDVGTFDSLEQARATANA